MTERRLRLEVRTPSGIVLSEEVHAITAEDGTGRFGLRPGAEPLLLVLVPSVLTYRSSPGGAERFVAVARGFLQLTQDSVLVSVRTALPCESLEAVREALARSTRQLRAGEAATHEAFVALQNRLYLHMIDEERAR